jgi:hypothetical protein
VLIMTYMNMHIGGLKASTGNLIWKKYWDPGNSISRHQIWAWRHESLPINLQVSHPIVAVLAANQSWHILANSGMLDQ